ncbi:hypothetical protein FE392_09570 [Xenorhabdus sp. 12]|uniref:Tail protein n=1 Tax=Xenorhabdus santafensis TaxID=2582833 RepID=A0ABU4S9U2_9GAMM|nr:phage tail protein [Xenorhabdus sp. 12]MDX7987577.1 hypothetical protein [Xenorhabdus sp. 12]
MSIRDSSNSVDVPTTGDVKQAIKEAIEEHAASRNHPYATMEDKGLVTLSNETDSDSEITVATSKAVKKAYDLANTANTNASNSVPIRRTINGYLLSADVILRAKDVGAYTTAETDSHISKVDALAITANQNATSANTNAEARLSKSQNGSDIPNKHAFVNNLGLTETITRAKNSIQGTQYTGDLTIQKAAWVKIAEVTMIYPSTININLIGGSGYNVGHFDQCAMANIVLRTGDWQLHGINAVMYTTNHMAPTDLVTVNTSGDNYDIYILMGAFAQGIILNAFTSDKAVVHRLSDIANTLEIPEGAIKGRIYAYVYNDITP